MFVEALFTIGKQPECPLTDKWIKKMWYKYSGILLSHKKNDLEGVMLSEMSQTETNTV